MLNPARNPLVFVSLLPEQWIRNCLQIENQAAVSANHSNIRCDCSQGVFGLGQRGILERKFVTGRIPKDGQLENFPIGGCSGKGEWLCLKQKRGNLCRPNVHKQGGQPKPANNRSTHIIDLHWRRQVEDESSTLWWQNGWDQMTSSNAISYACMVAGYTWIRHDVIWYS